MRNSDQGTGSIGRSALVLGLALLSTATAWGEQPAIAASEASRDPDGFLLHTVASPYQAGETEIRVLMPDRMERDERLPVVYVLPVEAGNGRRFGDGFLEVKRHDLHNRHRAIFVAPTFSQLPWYADHPTDPEIRQESAFLEAVVPSVDSRYPTRADRNGRLLLGFSKSGWGAFSLLLRHPDRFGKAAAWDAPLMQERPDRFGMGPIFATQENFEGYRIDRLLERAAPGLRGEERLILLGYGNFRDQHRKAHALMERLEIRHVDRDGPPREHRWESGWVAEAVGLLLAGDD